MDFEDDFLLGGFQTGAVCENCGEDDFYEDEATSALICKVCGCEVTNFTQTQTEKQTDNVALEEEVFRCFVFTAQKFLLFFV